MKKSKLSIVYAFLHTRSDNALLYNKRRISSLIAVIMLVVGIIIVPDASAKLNIDRVDQVKVAFIFNIIRFVSWPETLEEVENEQLLLCLYQSDSLNHALTSLHGKKSSGRVIQVSSIQTLAESYSCHILVIASDSLDHFEDEITPDFNKPVLSIVDLTESEASATPQGNFLVALVRKGTHIGFQVNLDKSRQVGLWMSSKLLRLATIVGGDQ